MIGFQGILENRLEIGSLCDGADVKITLNHVIPTENGIDTWPTYHVLLDKGSTEIRFVTFFARRAATAAVHTFFVPVLDTIITAWLFDYVVVIVVIGTVDHH